jgi:hypothetical protein
MDSVSIVFIEVKKAQILGKGRLDVVAQVLAESIGTLDFILLQLLVLTMLPIILACDYANSKSLQWVPILAILYDGRLFEYDVTNNISLRLCELEVSTVGAYSRDPLRRKAV